MAYDLTAASSQYFSTASSLVTTYPCTLACWFNLKNTTNTCTFISLQNSTGQSRFQLSNNAETTPKRAVQSAALNSSGGIGVVGVNETAFSSGVWYHAAGVFSNSSSTEAFFNGAIGTPTGGGSVTPTGINQILIGARRSTTIGNYQNGLIAEVGIWSIALTAAEIASLAKGMTCDKIRPQSLVFYAPLVGDLIDQKGGLTITNNNSATVANHPRVYA
jgi:hypothetical protein